MSLISWKYSYSIQKLRRYNCISVLMGLQSPYVGVNPYPTLFLFHDGADFPGVVSQPLPHPVLISVLMGLMSLVNPYPTLYLFQS